MTYRVLAFVPALLLAACTQQPTLAATQAPTVATADPFETPITAPDLHVDAAESDAEALLIASAMSYLGKTTAEFDGHTMVVVEHDPEELLEEAFADPGFRALVAPADADPHDGVLTTPEASRLESAVLARL